MRWFINPTIPVWGGGDAGGATHYGIPTEAGEVKHYYSPTRGKWVAINAECYTLAWWQEIIDRNLKPGSAVMASGGGLQPWWVEVSDPTGPHVWGGEEDDE